jgi:hypothetical protein
MNSSGVTVINIRAGLFESRGLILDRAADYCLLNSVQTSSGVQPPIPGDKFAETCGDYMLSQITDKSFGVETVFPVLDSFQRPKHQNWKVNIDVRK